MRTTIKQTLLEIAGAFLPGVPKSERQEGELDEVVGKQERRIEQRRRERIRARVLSHASGNGRPGAEDYTEWMNLNPNNSDHRNSEGDADNEGA